MILNRQRSVRVSAAELGRFLARVERELKLKKNAVAVCLIADAEMARLNRTYRRKDYPTDVLSFPSDSLQTAGQGRGFLGDVAISPAVARRNAKEAGRALHDELRILILHGVLHLMGYDHEADHGEMERKERRLRRKLGLAS